MRLGPVAVVLALCCLYTLAAAVTLVVAPAGSGSECSQAQPCATTEAITRAASGDTIQLTVGTYAQLDLSGKSGISVSSTPGTEPRCSYLVECQPFGQGVGILVTGSNVQLNGFTVRGCATGVKVVQGDNLQIRDMGIYRNSQSGIWLEASFDVTMNDVYLLENAGDIGGGMFVTDSSSLVANRLVFERNVAFTDGGGLFVDEQSTITIRQSKWSNNTAGRDGGAIHMEDCVGPNLIENALFELNHASGDGGAVDVVMVEEDPVGVTLQLQNVIFTENTALGDVPNGAGGALLVGVASVTLHNVTMSKNVANSFAGALFVDGAGNVTASSTAFFENRGLNLNGVGYGAGAIGVGEASTLTAVSNIQVNCNFAPCASDVQGIGPDGVIRFASTPPGPIAYECFPGTCDARMNGVNVPCSGECVGGQNRTCSLPSPASPYTPSVTPATLCFAQGGDPFIPPPTPVNPDCLLGRPCVCNDTVCTYAEERVEVSVNADLRGSDTHQVVVVNTLVLLQGSRLVVDSNRPVLVGNVVQVLPGHAFEVNLVAAPGSEEAAVVFLTYAGFVGNGSQPTIDKGFSSPECTEVVVLGGSTFGDTAAALRIRGEDQCPSTPLWKVVLIVVVCAIALIVIAVVIIYFVARARMRRVLKRQVGSVMEASGSVHLPSLQGWASADASGHFVVDDDEEDEYADDRFMLEQTEVYHG